jgi:hypothetical protein
VTLEETVTASEAGSSITLSFVIYREAQEVAEGVAVFEKGAEC